jgi:acetoin utilization protein AcuB
MRLGEIMTASVKTVSPADSAEEAFQRMRLHRIHHLVVMEGRAVAGIVSDRDLGSAGGAALRRNRTVNDLMSRSVATGTPHMTERQAANLLRGRSIGCLPVVDGGKLVGIVTITDLLEIVGEVTRRASTDARWKPVRRMGRWPRVSDRTAAH